MPVALPLTFLTPVAALVGVAVIAPFVAAFLVARRTRTLRRALGLEAVEARLRTGHAVALLALFGLLAAAAAQPVVAHRTSIESRVDVEGYIVVDVSRSMLAAVGPADPTRYERALDYALALKSELADVPLGVASLTDRPLPHVFPTADGTTYESVVTSALGIEKPPPAETGLVRATTFETLRELATRNFFSAVSTKRVAIVLTDGESRPFDVEKLALELREEAIGLFLVRFWGEGERVWRLDGSTEPYRPDPASDELLANLSQNARAPYFAEDDVESLVDDVRAFLGGGPIVEVESELQVTSLAPWLALLGALPLAFLLVRRPR